MHIHFICTGNDHRSKLSAIGASDSNDIATTKHTEQTFAQIKKNVDKLIQGLELSL